MKRAEVIPTVLAIMFLAILWQVIAWKIGFPAIFPSLFELVKQVFKLFLSENFFIILLITILRGIIGFAFAFVLAFSFATLSIISAFWKSFFHPIIVVTRSIPVISFVLIALLWFSPPYLPIFIAIVTMFPVLYQNTLTGLEHTDNKLIEMAKVFGKSPFQRFITIYLPASKSFIYDGISTSMGFGWRAIIIGEVLAQPVHGIGTAMKQAQAYINVSELIAWTIIAVAVSYLFEGIIKLVRKTHFEKRLPKATNYDLNIGNQYAEIKTISIQYIEKRFNEKQIINSFTSTFDNQTITCIKGPSGKGKTTLLRLISQIEKPDSGQILFTKPLQIAYSFQDLRLLPWLTVSENIAYVLHRKHVSKQDISDMVAFLLKKMELFEHEQKFPHELSGGQQQRIGLARALAAQSDVLLLDEPLTGLDNDLKIRIMEFLSEWIAAYQPIVVWATHEDVISNNLKITEVFI